MTVHRPQGPGTETPPFALQGDVHGPSTTLPSMPPVRVCEPMGVLWNGVEYPVAHWDVHGFTLAQNIPSLLAPRAGRVIDVALLIGQGVTRIQMNVQCRLAAGSAPEQRYQFIDLDRAQSELLHRIVDYSVTRQELSLTQLLNDARETRELRQVTTQRMLAFRTGFQASLALAAIAGAAWMALGSLGTVTSRYAAVTATASSVSAPAAGMVAQLSADEGARVAAGDVLGFVRSPDHEDRVEALREQLRALEAEQAELRSRRAVLARQDAHGADMTESEEARLQAALRNAQHRLELEREQLATLMATGLPTQARQEARARQRAVVLGAENELAAARAALDALATARSHGVRPGSDGAAAMSLETIDLRMAHLSQEIAHAYRRDEELTPGLPILSPCDCVVAQVNRVQGEWVDPAQPLFLMAGDGPRAVHALVLADRASRIGEGDRARIQLADGQVLTGRVSRLSYDSRRAGMAGLQTDVFAAERYARVEVTPDQPLEADIGLTGSLSITTIDPLRWLRDWAGGDNG